MSYATAKRWFIKFRNGDFNLEDQLRPGRPTEIETEEIRESLEASPITSTRILAEIHGASHMTMHRKLISMGKVNKKCREVPHSLTDEQAERRLMVCKQLLESPFDERFIKRIVTCDEKWIFFNNPDRGRQWLSPGQSAESVVRQGRYDRKVMLCVWWNYKGLVHFELLKEGQTINSSLYSEQLERMLDRLEDLEPALVNRKRVLLQQDNAPAHTAKNTKRKIKDLDIELLPHPAYSPDLAPSYYHLFRSLAHFLRGKDFDTFEDIEKAVSDFFASKDPAWFHGGILALARRWQMTIEHDGLYFEE